MSRKALQLGFCLLVLAALATFNSPAAQAIDFSYTQSGVGSSMAKACNQAIQKIKDKCDSYGAITTDPGVCGYIFGPNGSIEGQICTCEATAAYCRISIDPQF